mmetsp:Transcript_54502/g.127334  ORF Transcript_54502/g.127334 Transcript_54502/m.127334 type:complete len:262 (-) Transcript_54502:3-788(-)
MNLLHGLEFSILDVTVILEGKTALEDAVHGHAHCPHIHLQGVVFLVNLWGPEDAGANFGAEPFICLDVTSSAKITQCNSALLICDVFAVHQVVVTLDISMYDELRVQVLDSCTHLLGNVDNIMAIYLAPLLHVHMEAVHQVLCILIHDDAYEIPFVENLVTLHYILMNKIPHHLCLSFDSCHRSLDFVNHLDCYLLTRFAVGASIHHSKCAFAKSLTHGVLLKESAHRGGTPRFATSHCTRLFCQPVLVGKHGYYVGLSKA